MATFVTSADVDANTVYVVSYHTNVGHYADDQDAFANTGVDNGPLHALANGVSGGNGVYAYGSSSQFPSQIVGNENSETVVRLIAPEKFAHVAYGGRNLFLPVKKPVANPMYQILLALKNK